MSCHVMSYTEGSGGRLRGGRGVKGERGRVNGER